MEYHTQLQAVRTGQPVRRLQAPEGQAVDLGELYRVLRANDVVEELDLSGCRVAEVQAKQLAELVLNTQRLRTLTLNRCGIRTLGGCDLADALKVNRSLTEVHLEGNELDDQVAFHLASALRVNTALVALYIGDNHINDGGLYDIAQALRENSALRTLDLVGNPVGAVGGMHVVDALQLKGTTDVVTTPERRRGRVPADAAWAGVGVGVGVGWGEQATKRSPR